MNVSKSTMHHIINEDLRLKGYQTITNHFLTNEVKCHRYVKAKALLLRHVHNGHRQILFTDEKLFDVGEPFNYDNDKQRAHHSASTVV